MKQLILDNIELGVQMPFADVSLQHLQDATKEGTRALLQLLGVNVTADILRLTGCEMTIGVNGSVSVSSGWLWYGTTGEILRFDGGTFTPDTGKYTGFAVVDNFGPNDPVQFTDANKIPISSHNIHADRVAVLTNVDSQFAVFAVGMIPRAFEPVWKRIDMLNNFVATPYGYPYDAQTSPRYRVDKKAGFVHFKGIMVHGGSALNWGLIDDTNISLSFAGEMFPVCQSNGIAVSISVSKAMVGTEGQHFLNAKGVQPDATVYLNGGFYL